MAIRGMTINFGLFDQDWSLTNISKVIDVLCLPQANDFITM